MAPRVPKKPSGPAPATAATAVVARPLGRRIVILVVAAAAIVVLIGSAMGERGYLEVARREAAGAAMRGEVEQLRTDNAELMADIAALKRDPYVVEKLAREKLGYARPGEVIYLFPPKEKAEGEAEKGTQ